MCVFGSSIYTCMYTPTHLPIQTTPQSQADEKNVAIIHCLTGKGRTATVLSALVCWLDIDVGQGGDSGGGGVGGGRTATTMQVCVGWGSAWRHRLTFSIHHTRYQYQPHTPPSYHPTTTTTTTTRRCSS